MAIKYIKVTINFIIDTKATLFKNYYQQNQKNDKK